MSQISTLRTLDGYIQNSSNNSQGSFQENGHFKEVIEGFEKPQKTLPPKLFYDERGSELFDEICRLEEYYLTRTELEIMQDNIDDIANVIGGDCLLIELGSGSSTKIRLLLEHIKNLAAYVPIDISHEHLIKSTQTLARDYPELNIFTVTADYTQHFEIPPLDWEWSRKVVYYPGSTIGNMTPEESRVFLERVAQIAGDGGGLLIGVDLKKNRGVIENAYNDKKGVTAEFNKNILCRLNRELGASFELDKWEHRAFYNDEKGRIEMHLKSREEQTVDVCGERFLFAEDETILTEYSYKYSLEEFAQIARGIFKLEKVWTDTENLFSIQYLAAL